MRRAKKFIFYVWSTVAAAAVIFGFAQSARAEKTITLSAGSVNVEVGQQIDVPIYIDTDGEVVNAVGFNINFPTENLEGLVPNRVDSAFPMWVSESATRIDCGIHGQQGFTGRGLVTTLRFKGRTAGPAAISITNLKVLFAGISVAGFSSNELSLTVYGAADPPDDVNGEQETSIITLKPPTLTTENIAPSDPADPVTQTTIPLPGASTTFGSLAQVSGQKGATEEEPLKPAEYVEAAVKGMFSKDSLLWTSVLPTGLLLIIIVFLGIKLYLSEKNRHRRMEHLLDKQLGTLAALESKIEIVEQKGVEGRDQYLKEIELAKAEVAAESSENKKENVTSSTAT